MRLAAVVLLFAGILAAADNVDETAGAWNGRAWNKMDSAMKVACLRGAYEGDGLCRVIAGAPSGWPASLTFGEIVSALDVFYKEPTNAPIPVVIGALAYVKRKADGASDTELKRFEAELRRRSR